MKTPTTAKAKKMTAGLVLAAALFCGGGQASAQQGIDPQTRDMLITKLTQVYLNLAPADSSKVAITLRLADLHAERARLDAMNELQAGCTQCTAGVADRKKALQYYQEVLPKTPDSSIGKVLAQVGHLYEMTGDQKAAIATYTRILADQKSPEARAEANLSLAELHFKRHDYPLARKHYGEVMSNPAAASKGLAAYRIAWCEFNDGHLQAGIDGLVTVLKSPELLSRGANAGVVQVDKQFQEEVSRDLATFMARRPVTVKDAAELYELSPENAKMANITYLASELERLGQAAPAVAVWRFTQEKQAKPQARLEGHIRLAQLQMEQKQTAEAAKDYAQALALWTTMGTCNETDCSELKARLRKFVIDWNRMEKKSPSEGLLEAYKGYLKTFPNEGDMALWAAIVAMDLKQYALANELDQKAATLATQTLASTTTDVAAKKEAGERLETSLLAAIESAELAKDAKMLDQAYSSYLASSREKKKALEVRYQQAKAIYDRGDYAAASDALKTVALSKEAGAPSTTNNVKEQAAELALDSLVLLKDDTRLEAWSSELAAAFPKNAGEFRGIARKSILTQSAATASKGDKASLEAAWATLARFDLQTATSEDKAAYYKNKLILAEKTERFADARDAVENMLRLPNLSAADQQYALSRKAWLAELVLDFDTALQTTQKLTGADFSGEKKWLKLAMYAELANKDAKPFYGQFLKDSKDEDKNVAIASQLVRESKDPQVQLKEIEKSKAILAKRPAILADLYLGVYAATEGKPGSLDIAKKALAQNGVAGTPAGKVLARALLLDEYSKLKTKISAHQLDGSNQKKMAQTLKARVALLEDTEKLVTKAVESADWTAQLVTLDLLAKQNDRFYQEVLALPVPAGLSDEEQGQYLQLLSEQAAPHQTRAADVAKKVGEFWSQSAALAAIDKDLDSLNGPVRALLVKEVNTLGEVAPDAKKTELAALAAKKENTKLLPELVTLESARKAVRETPMSRERLEALLSLEKQMGRQTMVAYLEGRLATLEGAQK